MSAEATSMVPVVAIVQARMTSTRLPGKVLKDICTKPLLWHLIVRLRRAENIDGIVVATSTDRTDDVIERWCNDNSVECFRGAIDDVLERFCGASQAAGASTVVRITADCPLIDPAVVDRVIASYSRGGCDYVATGPRFPDGLDVEVFSTAALNRASREAKLSSQREHVTPYIRRNPDKFSVSYVYSRTDLSHMRWTVDDEKDLLLVTGIFEALGPDGEPFDIHDIRGFLEKNPALTRINAGTGRNEGYEKSLKEDRTVRK